MQFNKAGLIDLKKKLLLLMILAIIVPSVAYWYLNIQSGPTVSISRLYNLNLQPGQTILVNITATEVSDMTSLRINLAWDPAVLQVSTGDPNGWRNPVTGVKYNLFEGTFLKSFTNSTILLVNDVDNTGGKITAIFVAINAQGISASGSGVVATINFTCINSGTTSIRITGPREGHSSLQKSTGDQIPHEDVDGLITDEGSPGVWTEFWFQATMGFAFIEVVIFALIAIVVVRWWRSQTEAGNEEEGLDELLAP
jgi:hypothetical protein